MKTKWFSKPKEMSKPIKHLAAAALMTTLLFGVAPPMAWCSTPDWLRSAALAPLPKYPDDTRAVLLLNEQVTTVGNNSEIKTRYRRAYRILRPEGRSFGTASAYFDSETRLTYFKAWCIPPSGKDYEIKEKDMVETALSAETLYEDVHRKVVQIPDSEPGSVVGYEYEQRRRPHILQDTWELQDEVPARQARFELRLPPGWEYGVSWLNFASRKPQHAENNTWLWEVADVPPVEDEPSMPAWRSLAGRLGITYFPPGPNPAIRGDGMWTDIGLWYSRLTAGQRQDTPEIQQKVAELVVGETRTLGKIQTLASFVQSNVRYVAIEIGAGGYQPHHAQVTFANRYGDCKDKATLLASMLHGLGISAFYVLVNSERGVVSPTFPTVLDFNHVILAISLPPDVPSGGLWAMQDHQRLGHLLYFDPTDSLVPLGYLPESLQESYGLLVTAEGGELVKLPLLPPSVNRLFRSAKLALNAEGTITGDVVELRWGAPATEMRAQLLSVSQADRQKMLENFLAGFLGAFVLQGSQVEGLDKYGETLKVQYHFTAASYAKSAGNLLLLRPRVLGRKSMDLRDAPSRERKNPVEFASATSESDLVDIQLPEGYQVDELPPPTEIDSGLFSYKSRTEANSNVLHYSRLYQIKEVMVPTAKVGQLKQFYRQISADERGSAVLRRLAP